MEERGGRLGAGAGRMTQGWKTGEEGRGTREETGEKGPMAVGSDVNDFQC